MEMFPAHGRTRNGEMLYQTVQAHCRGAAETAKKALSGVRLGSAAYLAGLLHDAGKFTDTFRDYLLRALCNENAPRGSVNHTFAGVRFLLERYHVPKDGEDMGPVAAELLAYAVGAHHGLFDCVDERGKSGFRHRLDKPDVAFEEAMGNFLAQCAEKQELDRLFGEAVRELTPVLIRFRTLAQPNDSYYGEVMFYLGLLARLLLSAVIEGDRTDTAAFMNGVEPTGLPEDRRPMWNRCLASVEEKLGGFPSDTPVARARREISDRCHSFAEKPGGVYRLNVPTGGGKTLSSLRYALGHAAKWNKSRIIFTSPLLSILDQNAQVLRSFIQQDSLILEHHSNVVHSRDDSDAILEGTDAELMAENWSAPIIITTLVQLLNTFFSGKTACIRRFQALTDSVIVIDEVQTVPNRMLALFNLTVSFLSEICGATVVLCSATQPCLEQAEHPITVPVGDIIAHDAALWEAFRRTEIVDAGARALEDIPSFILDRLEGTDSLLVICNKKSEAEFLYRELSGRNARCFHLSASMCAAHRRKTLEAVQASLARPGKTLCIATQVVEAGVDLSFGCVIRLTAGLDNVIQAAGRCNRNGEAAQPGHVYVLECAGERLGNLQEIQRSKDAMVSLLARFRGQPEAFQNDLSSDEAVRCYYRRLYREMPLGYQDYPVRGGPSLYSLLSLNEDSMEEETGFALNQAFKRAGALFRVFDEETEDVLTPYGGGADCIADLQSCRAGDPCYRQACLDRAKVYTVSLFRYQTDLLERQGGLYSVCDGSVLVLRPDFYDEETGVRLKPVQANYLEV